VSLFVIDADVAIKWFLPEIHSDAALRLVGQQHTLHAPDLIFSEFGNVLWKRVRKNEISRNEAEATMQAFLSLPLQVESSRRLVPLAFEIASGQNRTVYDSLYLAAAIALQFPLVTVDAKFYRALNKGPFSGHLVWVEDIPHTSG
jgi:predicted nucleic acid-binding protein